ncbi:MAG: hypothetical protein GY822_20315 [Deltaproteobacteria bacterium]|nr:hypothetical protein [Deltaproteobacteria bacterium]
MPNGSALVILPLLDDGQCSIASTCKNTPSEARPQCPQSRKCGTCVAWSPRQGNAYGRNSGQCMLSKESTIYLDCNAQICPYYAPRRENPAFAEFQTYKKEPSKSPTRRRLKMERESPPPTPEALASMAFRDHDEDTASIGQSVLAAHLEEYAPLPVLLERFRGGCVRVVVQSSQNEGQKELPIEAFYARLVQLKSSMDALDDAIADSSLGDDEKGKIEKDLGGMGGALTTFNVLFRDKADHFRGQKR